MDDGKLVTPSPQEQVALQALVDGLAWRACTRSYAAQVGLHEYVVRHQTCPEKAWAVLQEAIRRYGRREQYLVTGNAFTYLFLGEHRYWTAPGREVINRARQSDVAGKHGPPAEERSRLRKLNLDFRGGQVTNVDTGEVYDIAAVVRRMPWVATIAISPHEYVVREQCHGWDFSVLAFVVNRHPASFLAYYRAYRRPFMYLELDLPLLGLYRYWYSVLGQTHMLNRCRPETAVVRRVDQGGKPIKGWKGLPYEYLGDEIAAGRVPPDAVYCHTDYLPAGAVGVYDPASPRAWKVVAGQSEPSPLRQRSLEGR